MATHGIRQDEQLCAEVLLDPSADTVAPDPSSLPAVRSEATGSLVLSSAYLNLTLTEGWRSTWSPLARTLSKTSASLTLILASDASHGFHSATGLSYYIPSGCAARQ